MKLITKEVEGYCGEVLINEIELKDISSNVFGNRKVQFFKVLS